MANDSIPIIKEIAPQAGIAGGTISGGMWFNSLPVFLENTAIVAGIILSLMLAWKAYNDIQNNKRLRRAEIEDIRYRRDHDLPCRRCSDD